MAVSKKCISVICPKHGPLIELDLHCHNIARYFIAHNQNYDDYIASWFRIASGIEETRYISDKFDDLVVLCRPAIEYEDAKSNFHSKLITELTRFNFIWGGFEAYYDLLEIPSCPDNRKRGIANNVSYFLGTAFPSRFQILRHYSDVVNNLRDRITLTPSYGKASEIFIADNCTKAELLGLKAVYKLRNSFAHGSIKFSEPEDWSVSKPYDLQIILASSRLLLLTMQMLLLANASANDLEAEIPKFNEIEFGPKAFDFLSQMHLLSYQEPEEED